MAMHSGNLEILLGLYLATRGAQDQLLWELGSGPDGSGIQLGIQGRPSEGLSSEWPPLRPGAQGATTSEKRRPSEDYEP